MIPPNYALVPPGLFFRSDVPLHLRWTYVVLYALAWRHQYQYVTEQLDELAGMFSEIEGEQITERGVRERLQRLVQYGLIEREKKGVSYRTYLLLQHKTAQPQPATAQPQPSHSQPQPSHSQPQPATADQVTPGASPGSSQVTLPASPGLSEVTPGASPNVTCFNNSNVGDVDDLISRLDQHQQHLFYYLLKREVFPKTARDFALRRIPLWEAVGWGEYAYGKREYLTNYPGVIVKHLGDGDPAPEATLEWCPMCGNQWRRNCTCGFMDALDAEE